MIKRGVAGRLEERVGRQRENRDNAGEGRGGGIKGEVNREKRDRSEGKRRIIRVKLKERGLERKKYK